MLILKKLDFYIKEINSMLIEEEKEAITNVIHAVKQNIARRTYNNSSERAAAVDALRKLVETISITPVE